MRQLVLSALALVPLWSAAQTPAVPAAAAPSATPTSATQPSGPQPIAIEPAAGPSSPLPVAAAPSATDRSYLFARLGTMVPRTSDLRGFENGIAVEAGAGTRLTRYLAVEVGTGYLRTSQVEKGTNDTVGSYQVKQDLSAVPLVATVRVSTHARGFEAYALAGGGLYLWALGGTVSSSQYAPYSFSDTSTELGAHVGAGLSASLSSRFTLGLEAKYLLARATLFGHTSDLGSAIVSAAFGYAF